MNLSELTPDTALAALLDGNVEVQTSEKSSRKVRTYAQAEQSQTGLADEFISVFYNGTVRSLTRPLGIFRGNLAITLYCKSNSDGTAKKKRIASMIEQCEFLVNGTSLFGFYFELDPSNVITPTTVNLTNGYAITVLNVKWNTIHE
ncbi:hypothetical protein [Muribaculum intestinale]|uniref:hypothetical protein n=1 Tax=Muribaculum intestinale TaxID=1796646 RepID=UPI0025B71310|nr:hypothetical protein [Muribaculum intestinale]